MTNAPGGNVVEVKPTANIYTVLLIIALLALVVGIGAAGWRLMAPVPENDSAAGGYGVGVMELFKPFDQQKLKVDSGEVTVEEYIQQN